MADNVVPPKCDQKRAEARIQALAMKSTNVKITNHAWKRTEERGFSDRDLHNILQTGYVDEEPKLTENREWKCKVVKRLRDGRDAGAVTVLSRGSLIVLTVEWEDLR